MKPNEVIVSDISTVLANTKRPNLLTQKMDPVQERRIRFAVTLLDEDGEAMWTQHGFTIDPYRKVRVPMQRTKFGGQTMQFTHLHESFAQMLKEAVLAIPDVVRELGPVPDNPESFAAIASPKTSKPLKGRASVSKRK